MKWYVVAMMLVMGSIEAGIVKQQPQPEITAEVNAYDASKNVQLQPLIDAEVGQTIGFKLGERIVVAVKEHHNKTPQGFLITGTFLGRKKAGFVFEFSMLPDKQIFIQGVLFFKDSLKFYTLEMNDKTREMFFLEHDMELDDEVGGSH